MTGTSLAFPTPSSLGSLDHYIQAVNRFPLLSAEQEIQLGRRLRWGIEDVAAGQVESEVADIGNAERREALGAGCADAR